jgi:hypothetical protein
MHDAAATSLCPGQSMGMLRHESINRAPFLTTIGDDGHDIRNW